MIDRKFSRRGFLKGSTATAAAVAFPTVITTAALGSATKAPASERVALGHIGTGGQGSYLFGNFQQVKNAQSVAIADPNAYKNRREERAAQCGGKAYNDFRELLERKDIDAVVIATPDHWHVPIGLYAGRAGKDCYIEKPLGVCVEQDLLIRKLFAEKKLVFQYGTQQRSQNPQCYLGCELVRAGKIGKVKALEVIAPNGGSGGSTQEAPIQPEGFDYNMWIGPAPMKPFTVDRCHPQGTYWIYDYSIGYLGGWGAHPLDILVWGNDYDLEGPYTVEGTGKIPETGLYDTVYDWDMVFTYSNGVKMTFKPGGDSTKFIGEEGWIRISRGNWDAEPKSLMNEKIKPGEGKLIHSTNHYQNFVDAVKSREGAVSHLVDAVRSDIMSHMCDLAVRLSRPVTWDPKKDEVVNDAEATKMLHRPVRAPWSLTG